jgi:hypothetical protein
MAAREMPFAAQPAAGSLPARAEEEREAAEALLDALLLDLVGRARRRPSLAAIALHAVRAYV